MQLFRQPSTAARMALVYITVGALAVIWTCVWYIYLGNHPPATSQPYYWCAGILATGLTLVVIGLAVGRIGRSARKAEHPPQIVAPPVNAAPTATVVPTAPSPQPAVAAPMESPLVNGRSEPALSSRGGKS